MKLGIPDGCLIRLIGGKNVNTTNVEFSKLYLNGG